jgi:hypothetical protein
MGTSRSPPEENEHGAQPRARRSPPCLTAWPRAKTQPSRQNSRAFALKKQEAAALMIQRPCLWWAEAQCVERLTRWELVHRQIVRGGCRCRDCRVLSLSPTADDLNPVGRPVGGRTHPGHQQPLCQRLRRLSIDGGSVYVLRICNDAMIYKTVLPAVSKSSGVAWRVLDLSA